VRDNPLKPGSLLCVKNSLPFPLDQALVRVSVPLAAMAAMAAFAAHEAVAAAAEGAYLAVLSGSALLAVAFLAPAPAAELGAGATLAVAAVWSLPPGPGRGAVVTLLLTALLAIAAARRLAASFPDVTLEAALPLAMGLQVLLRGQILFHPQANLRTLVALLALPAAGTVAATLLARRHGGGSALLAAGTALLLAPGWNVAATLGLIALAAGDQLARTDLGRLGKGAALLVLMAPIAWEPGPGLATAVAGLALWRPRLACGLAVPASVLLLGLHGRWHIVGWPLVGAVWFLPLLVPGALFPERGRVLNTLTAILLVVATPQIPDASALAAPLALAALAVRWDSPAAIPQRVWTGTLLAGTALLVAYPWLRDEPLEAALALGGLEIGWRSGVVILAVFLVLAVGLGGILSRFLTRGARPSPPPGVETPDGVPSPLRGATAQTGAASSCLPSPGGGAGGAGRGAGGEGLGWATLSGLSTAVIFLAVLIHLPRAGTTLLAPESGVLLDPAHPVWVAEYPTAQRVSGVMVESSLSGGADLAHGTAVATVRTDDGAGRTVLWVLRAGEETGEWAARRPDVERTAILRSPPAWISWVAGDFFGQRYRARWTLPKGSTRLRDLRVERAPGLPPDVGLTLHQVEIRR